MWAALIQREGGLEGMWSQHALSLESESLVNLDVERPGQEEAGSGAETLGEQVLDCRSSR